jgi:phosphoribosylformylglycinamidine synthase
MKTVRVAVLFGFGINCDHETAAVFRLVGAEADRLHVNRLIASPDLLSSYDILAIPGGFSFGDHLGSGRLLGNRLRFALRDPLRDFVANGGPVIGICNGFQVLVKTGLLPGPPAGGDTTPDFEQRASLALNESGRYEDRWVTLEFDQESPCVWTQGLTRIDCPVRHGEGRFVVEDESVLDEMDAAHQLVVRYVDPATPRGEGRTDERLPYPTSPNGSARNIAGVCDATGLVFGLMPHPEAVYAKWLHPDHTRYTAPEAEASVPVDERSLGEWEGEGLQMFRNAVEHVRNRSI